MRYGNVLLNFLTLLVMVAATATCAYAAVVAANPYLPINPYPPPTRPPVAVLPSATITSTPKPTVLVAPTLPPTFTKTATITVTLPPSDTPTVSATPDLSQTPEGTLTETPEATTELVDPTNTSAPTFTPTKTRSAFPFTIKDGAPIPLPNSVNSLGCNWMGIAGQAFGSDGAPIVGYWVHLEGGGNVADAMTGTQRSIGDGGYELFLSNHPVQTTGEYKVQLFKEDGKTPVSDVIVVNTFADCSKNWLMVNFERNH